MDGMAAEVIEGGEAALLAQLRAGRPAAYAALMRRHNQRLYRLARGILRDDAEAEEAVQEGYLRAFTSLDGFKGEASVATWLARIVLNEALGRLRRRRPTVDIEALAETPADADGVAALAPQASSPEQAAARRELRRAIEQAVDTLPPGFRSVFILRAVEQMSVAETALSLGIPAETVKTRLHRANKLLRRALHAQFAALLDGAFPFLGPRCDRLVATVLERLGLAAEVAASAPPGDRPAPGRSPP
jgi:RNA polymerase sigma-70 factor, ECF subfamily